MPVNDSPERKDFVASLAKGLSILAAFDVNEPQMTLTEVATKVSMTRATARRYLLTLLELGYVSQAGRKFSLTPRVLDLGYAYMASVPILEFITPILEEVAVKTGLVNGFAIISKDEAIVLAHGSASRFIASGAVGVPRPAYCTASGRAVLAFWNDEEIEAYLKRVPLRAATEYTITDREKLLKELNKVRRQGYALVNQESELGRLALGVPILDRNSRPLGSLLTVVNPALTSKKQLLAQALAPLIEAADQIRERLPRFS